MEQIKYALQVGETMKALKEYVNQGLRTHWSGPATLLAKRLGKPKKRGKLAVHKTNSLLSGTTPFGDPNHPFCSEVAGITLLAHHTWVSLEPQPPRDNLGQWTPLTTHVNLPLTWSFSSEKQQKCERDIQATETTAVSLNIRTQFCLQGKNLDTCIYRKILSCDHYSLSNIWALYLKLSGVPCLQNMKQMAIAHGYQQGSSLETIKHI